MIVLQLTTNFFSKSVPTTVRAVAYKKHHDTCSSGTCLVQRMQ